LKEELRRELGIENVFLASKGRVGLYGLLKAMNIGKGDEVILPAYTCVVVPNAIIYLGATPIYVDILPETYNIDYSKIQENISGKTKLIIAQNTYGLSSELDEINAIAEQNGIEVIEDCTHGFGGRYKGVLNGRHVKAAFYSTQWNKMFSTGVGGIIVVNDPVLAKKMDVFENTLVPASRSERLMLQCQLILKDLLGYSRFYWGAINLYRYLSQNNIIAGSSAGEEIVSTEMPKNYLKAFNLIH